MKKVRYMADTLGAVGLGAVGIVPAIGMLAQGPTVAATHTPAKTVKTVSTHHIKTDGVGCGGSSHHVKNSHPPSGAELVFWSTPHGGRTCIGTIEGFVNFQSPGNPGSGAKVWVARPGHNYCGKTGSIKVVEPCHTSFTRPFTIFLTSKLGAKVSWRV